jgi:hypothetical protein
MAQSRTSTNHAVGSSPAFTAAPGTLDGWWITAGGQHLRFVSLGNSADNTNVFELTTDITGNITNGISAYTENTSSNQNAALTNTAFPLGSWGYAAAVFSSASVNNAYCTGAAKASHTVTAVPSGVNRTAIPGRVTDFTSAASSFAHVCAWARALSDLEVDYRQKGGNPRWLNPARYWKFAVVSGTPESPIVDQQSHENLTVTGLVAAASDPVLATYWTAAAFGNQSHTQGSAISAVDLTTKFDQMAAAVDYTCTLRRFSAPGTPTTATAAATTPSNQITVASITGFATNSFVSITNSTTPVLILDITGNTLLIGAFQTWGSGDNVYPIATSALTLTGPAITANSYGGTPASGDVGTYSAYIQAANTTTSTLIGVSPPFNITVASSGAAPSFSAGPTLTSANTDGYTFGATSNQTATAYLLSMTAGSAAPSQAQMLSGSPTGFISRVTAAATAATPFSISVTGLTQPVYDEYLMVNNGSGSSAVVAFAGQLKSAGTTQQYVTASVRTIIAITKAVNAKITVTAHGFTSGYWVEHYGVGGMTQMNGIFDQITVVDANNYTLNNTDSTGFTTFTSGGSASWGQSIDAGSSAAVATGDIRILDLVTNPDGCAIICQPDGSISIAAGTITQRQRFSANVYSLSAAGLIGSVSDYFQDIAPTPPAVPGNVLPAIILGANQAIVPVNLSTLASDPQGDTLTATVTGLPGTLSVTSSVLSGTTGASVITPITITWANSTGENASVQFNLVIGTVTPPNLQGLSQGDIINLLAGYYLTPTFGQQDNVAASGTAIAQNPAFGIPVQPNTQINVTLSTGIVPVTQVLVPDVSSNPTDQVTATALLSAAGFTVSVPQPWTGNQKITQYPTAGSLLTNGSVVSLFLQAGSPRITRPRKRVTKTKNAPQVQAPYVLRRPKRR